MRLFVALLFEAEKKDIIFDILQEAKLISSMGSYTTYENLHLTLVYIGETTLKKLKEIKAKLSEINCESFNYRTNKIKCFNKSNGQKIVYLGVDQSEELHDVHHQVIAMLNDIGYKFPYEKYTPHITFGRKVKFKEFETGENIYCNSLTLEANKISIMESKKVDGRLVYEELFSIPLK